MVGVAGEGGDSIAIGADEAAVSEDEAEVGGAEELGAVEGAVAGDGKEEDTDVDAMAVEGESGEVEVGHSDEDDEEEATSTLTPRGEMLAAFKDFIAGLLAKKFLHVRVGGPKFHTAYNPDHSATRFKPYVVDSSVKFSSK